MSSETKSVTLTKGQKALLRELEEEFKDRYTENDNQYDLTLRDEDYIPPVVDNWEPPYQHQRNRGFKRSYDQGNNRYGEKRRRDDQYDNDRRHHHSYQQRPRY